VHAFEEAIQETLEGVCTAVEHACTAGCTIDVQQGWKEFLDEMPRGFRTCATDTASMEWKEASKVELPAPSHEEGKSGCHLFLTACTMLELEVATTQERVQEVIDGKLTECSVQASELVGQGCLNLISNFIKYAMVRCFNCGNATNCMNTRFARVPVKCTRN
jgi:hypothetical protein